jgi:hypothetical protein
MQADRIAGVAKTAGSVRGLGVCDVLRIELAPVQRAGLELQLAARVAALERRLTLQRRRAAFERRPAGPWFEAGDDAGGLAADREPGEAGEELRLLTRMRASVPARAVCRRGPGGPGARARRRLPRRRGGGRTRTAGGGRPGCAELGGVRARARGRGGLDRDGAGLPGGRGLQLRARRRPAARVVSSGSGRSGPAAGRAARGARADRPRGRAAGAAARVPDVVG